MILHCNFTAISLQFHCNFTVISLFYHTDFTVISPQFPQHLSSGDVYSVSYMPDKRILEGVIQADLKNRGYKVTVRTKKVFEVKFAAAILTVCHFTKIKSIP